MRFLFIGRYERRKGIEELHEAIQKVSDPRAEFHFIGPIPEKHQLQRQNVYYHGPLAKQEAIQAISRTCDVLVCPSYSEGMPNVILEAMASGLMILTTDVGAVNLMVDSDNGTLIAIEELKQLHLHIESILSLKEAELMQKKLSSIAKVKAHFLWDDIAKRHLEFFELNRKVS